MSQQAFPGGPGWTARILFWAGLVIGSMPELVLMPMLISGTRPEFLTSYSVLRLVVVILGLALGLVALFIVRASPLTMRLFGVVVFLFVSIYAFVLPQLMPIVVNRVFGAVSNFGNLGAFSNFGGFALALNIQSIIWAFHGGVVLAGTLIAWNLARNRAWWTSLVAAGYALLMGLIVAFVEWLLNVLGTSFATSMILTQLVVLSAVFGGLGLLYVVGVLSNMGLERRNGHPPSTKPYSYDLAKDGWHLR